MSRPCHAVIVDGTAMGGSTMRRRRLSLVGMLISAAVGATAGTLGAGLGDPLPAHAATIVDLPTPVGSVSFGTELLILSNGNFVVSDPDFVHAGAAGAGA